MWSTKEQRNKALDWETGKNENDTTAGAPLPLGPHFWKHRLQMRRHQLNPFGRRREERTDHEMDRSCWMSTGLCRHQMFWKIILPNYSLVPPADLWKLDLVGGVTPTHCLHSNLCWRLSCRNGKFDILKDFFRDCSPAAIQKKKKTAGLFCIKEMKFQKWTLCYIFY